MADSLVYGVLAERAASGGFDWLDGDFMWFLMRATYVPSADHTKLSDIIEYGVKDARQPVNGRRVEKDRLNKKIQCRADNPTFKKVSGQVGCVVIYDAFSERLVACVGFPPQTLSSADFKPLLDGQSENGTAFTLSYGS